LGKLSEKRGFTLLELLIVLAIIIVLMTIAIVIYNGTLEKVRAGTCAANRRSLKAELTAVYMTEHSTDAVETKYQAGKQEFVCPDGGTISYSLDADTGVVTTRCSKHSETGGESAADAEEAKNKALGDAFSSLISSGLKKGVNNANISGQKNNAASAWYNSLTDEQKTMLSQYYWSYQEYYNKVKKAYEHRVFYAESGSNKTVTGIYKIRYNADTKQYEYQYNPDATISASGKVGDDKKAGAGSNWGAVVNGTWQQNGWSSTMAGASAGAKALP
jgi:prepilin-type N-terminal cleavage/methylation domain-containing protein